MLVNGDVRKNNEFDGMIMAVATPSVLKGCCMYCANKYKNDNIKSVCDDAELHCVANVNEIEKSPQLDASSIINQCT